LKDARVNGEDNIDMDIEETGRKGVIYIAASPDKGQWRGLANMVMNLRVPEKGWVE
jgi:hypothetical protein